MSHEYDRIVLSLWLNKQAKEKELMIFIQGYLKERIVFYGPAAVVF